MAYDKVVDSVQLDADLASVASLIKEKTGMSDDIVWPQGFLDAISGISAGGSAKVVSGTFTITENGTYTVEHGLDKVPDFIVLTANIKPHSQSTTHLNNAIFHLVGFGQFAVHETHSTGSTTLSSTYQGTFGSYSVTVKDGAFHLINDTTITFGGNIYILQGGIHHTWIAGGV